MTPTIPTLRLLSPCTIALLCGACSTFPPSEMPPFADHELEVRWAAQPAPRSVRVPASDDAVTVYALEVTPAPLGESFENGARFLLLPARTEVTAHCRLRAWDADPGFRPASLFPGAASVGPRP